MITIVCILIAGLVSLPIQSYLTMEEFYLAIIIYLSLIMTVFSLLLAYCLICKKDDESLIIKQVIFSPQHKEPDPEPSPIVEEQDTEIISEPVIKSQYCKPERVAIFVDSKNLYLSIKNMLASPIKSGSYSTETFNQATENIEGFIRGRGFNVISFLQNVLEGRNCTMKKYYRGFPLIPFGDESSAALRDQEAKRNFINLMIENGYDVPVGGVEVKIHGKPQEKGVDTLLTMDVLEGALNDVYDTAIIVSSDRDFIPLIHRIKKLGKRFMYVTLSHNVSRDMKKEAYRTKVYYASDIKKYIITKD